MTDRWNQYPRTIIESGQDILKARLQFRQLLEEHGLVSLAGSEAEALSWLESQVIQLADSVSRRERFLELVRQVREGLKREQEREILSRGQEESRVLPNGGRIEKANPHGPRGFRKFNI